MGKPRILIVDDEPVILSNMAYILGECGFEVKTAGLGKQAAELLNTEFFNFVITDVRLPDMSGADLVAGACEKRNETRFFFHTGAHDYQITPELVRCGMRPEDILYKPLPSIRELAERLLKGV